MLKGGFGIRTPEKLAAFAEELAVAKELIAAGTPVKTKIALIALDHLAETLMGYKAVKLFDKDNFIKRVVPPTYPMTLQTAVTKYFPEKVKFIRR